MAYLGSEKLKLLAKHQNIIMPFEQGRVVCGAYELSLGDEIFRTDSKDRKKETLTQPKEQITINPGQFALLLSHESVSIPQDKIAFISIKAGIKLKGLVNVSGFHVDPGFKGKLVFSVYNAGSGPVSLIRNEPCFLIWFAELDLFDNEKTSYENGSHEHKGQDSIPVKYIDSLLSGELASPHALSKRIDDVDHKKSTNEWILRIILGVVVAIAVKLWWDNTQLKSAIETGYNKKANEIVTDSAYEKIQRRINSIDQRLDTIANEKK